MLMTTGSFSSFDDTPFSNLHPKILIVGAGLTGLSTYHALNTLGIKPDIIERRKTHYPEGAGIALPANAIWALNQLGLHPITDAAYTIDSMSFTRDNGTLLIEESLSSIHHEKTPFKAIHRADLHDLLAQRLNTIRFNTFITHLDFIDEKTSMTFQDGSTCLYDLVIGADGIHSSIRQLLYKDKPLITSLPLRI